MALTKTYERCNTGTATAVNQTLITSTPAGYVYASHVAEIGTYDPTTLTWTIGSIPAGECYDLAVEYVAHATETTPCNDGDCDVDPISLPVNINHGDTYTVMGKLPCSALCSKGTTVINVVSTTTNIDVDMEVSSGNYIVTVNDVTQPWEFQYTVTCYECDNTFGPFGPGVVSGDEVQMLPPYTPSWFLESFTLAGGETSVAVVGTATLPATDQIWVNYNGQEIFSPADYTVAANVVNLVSLVGNPGDIVTVRWIEY